MGKNIIILVICAVVIGAMVFIMTAFTKKLAKLEQERWGDKAKVRNTASGEKKTSKDKKKKIKRKKDE